eukprot:gene34838-42189_t
MGLPVFRKRDLLVLSILLATFYHFSQHLPSASFRLQPSWFVELSDTAARSHESSVQVVDIDGDGDQDLLLIDKDESVRWYKLRSITDFESTDIYHPEEIATIGSMQGAVVCASEPHDLFLYCVTKDGKLKAVNTHNGNNDLSLVWAVDLSLNGNNTQPFRRSSIFAYRDYVLVLCQGGADTSVLFVYTGGVAGGKLRWRRDVATPKSRGENAIDRVHSSPPPPRPPFSLYLAEEGLAGAGSAASPSSSANSGGRDWRRVRPPLLDSSLFPFSWGYRGGEEREGSGRDGDLSLVHVDLHRRKGSNTGHGNTHAANDGSKRKSEGKGRARKLKSSTGGEPGRGPKGPLNAIAVHSERGISLVSLREGVLLTSIPLHAHTHAEPDTRLYVDDVGGEGVVDFVHVERAVDGVEGGCVLSIRPGLPPTSPLFSLPLCTRTPPLLQPTPRNASDIPSPPPFAIPLSLR